MLYLLSIEGWQRSTGTAAGDPASVYRVDLSGEISDAAGRRLVHKQTVQWEIPTEGATGVGDPPGVRMLFDSAAAASANLICTASDDASLRYPCFPGGQTLLFQGLWTDPTTGIAYARNRWYDARNASWLSEDPKGAVDSVNLYAFVGWGPHMGRDPMGLMDDVPNTMTGTAFGNKPQMVGHPADDAIVGFGLGLAESAVLTSAAGMLPGYAVIADNAQFGLDLRDGNAGENLLNRIPIVGTVNQASEVPEVFANKGNLEGGRALGHVTFRASVELALLKAGIGQLRAKLPQLRIRAQDVAGPIGRWAGAVKSWFRGLGSKGADDVILGGRHRSTKVDGTEHGTQSHHLIADDASNIAKEDALAIRMITDDHVYRTGNWGSRKSSKRFRAQQRQLIEEGRHDEALQLGIDDVKTQNPGSYIEHILQALESAPRKPNGEIDWSAFKKK